MAPNGWQAGTLADLANYINGRAFKPADWSSHGLPIIRIAQITDPNSIPNHYAGDDVDGRHLVRNGDLLFSWSATLAAIRWWRGDAILNQHIFKVVEKPGIARAFLQHLLVRSIPSLAEESHGSTMKHIRKGVLDVFRVLVPPLDEQRKIAAILSSVDNVIETTQAVIDQLQVVKKAMMAELLTRGLPGRHTCFKQTEIGEVPEDWTISRIGTLVEDTAYGTSAKCESHASGLPVLRIPNVVTERVTFDDLKYTALRADEVASYRLAPGDVLVIRTNGNPSYVGRAAVVPDLEGPCLYASYLIRLRVKREVVSPYFLHEAMRSTQVRKTMQGAIRTSAGNYNLNTQGIANTVVPVPSLTEQADICAVGRVLEDRREAEEAALASLVQLKSALMSVLLTGEVRVTPDEAAA